MVAAGSRSWAILVITGFPELKRRQRPWPRVVKEHEAKAANDAGSQGYCPVVTVVVVPAFAGSGTVT